MNEACLSYKGKRLDESRNLGAHSRQEEDTLRTNHRMTGGAIAPEELKAALNRMESQMHHWQHALAREQAGASGGYGGGMKGQTKDNRAE